MNLGEATGQQLLAGAVVSLAGVVVVLWRELTKSREEAESWRQMWAVEMKQRSRDGELFLRALEKWRSESSDTPPDSPSRH